MASVAIPMVAGFAAQKLATDVLGVDPKMAAVLGMAAGGGASAWQAGGGSLGSLFGNTAGSAAGSAAPTIGQNMFGQTAGMAGMSPKVGGGLISAAGTTAGAVPASLGYNAHAAGTHGMDMFASSVNPHAGLASNAFTQNPYVPIEAGGFTGSADAPAQFFPNNSPQTFTGVNAPFSSMASGNGYAGTPYTPMQSGGVTGSADAPARLAQYSNVDLMGGQGSIPTEYERMASMQPGMDMFAPSQYDQMASMYPGMDDPSLYMNTSATTTPLPNRPEIPSQNYNPINQNYQADEDMYTAQLFRDGNTVRGSGVAEEIPDFINKDALRLAEMPGNQLDTLGYERATASLNSPTTPPQYPEYDAYARATHGMDEYAMNEYDMMAREPIANFPQVDQAIANTRPNPAEVGGNTSDWSKQSGTTRADRMRDSAVERQSDKISKSLDELIDGEDKPSWWDKAENQQFLMQAASILLSDDIEEQQVSSGGGGGGGPPSPGVYSGGSSPAPKVVFGMGPYNGQGQQGYNPREIM